MSDQPRLPGLGGEPYRTFPIRMVAFGTHDAPGGDFKVANVQMAGWQPAAGMRGLVVSNPIDPSGSGISISGQLEPSRLRTWTLLWDRLDFPTNNYVNVDIDDSLQILEREGILRRTKVNAVGSMTMGADLAKIHLAAFRQLDTTDPGVWSIATGPGTFNLPTEELTSNQGLRLRLTNAVAVPDAHVPLEAVLEFRARRRPELLALRAHLDEVYQQIIGAPDRPIAEHQAFSALDKALADQIKSAYGAGFAIRLSPLEAELKVGFIPASVAAAVVALPHGLVAATAAALSTAALQVLGSVGLTSALNRKNTSSLPFAYVGHYSKELPLLCA